MLTPRVSSELHNAIAQRAAAGGVSIEAFVRAALEYATERSQWAASGCDVTLTIGAEGPVSFARTRDHIGKLIKTHAG
ncbi:MAG: toxin-antitoxin system HicB family antitoxin [Planctomycetota bacterium]